MTIFYEIRKTKLLWPLMTPNDPEVSVKLLSGYFWNNII